MRIDVEDRLPLMCATFLESTGEPILIKRGETGYFPANHLCPSHVPPADWAREWNRVRGISACQRMAMEMGSCFGWDCSGADPKTYDEATAASSYGITLED